MITIRHYPDRYLADIDKSVLDAAGIPSFIMGLGVAWEGGISGIELKVHDEQVEEALALLEAIPL